MVGIQQFPATSQVDDRGNGQGAAGGFETLSRFGQSSFVGVSGQLWVAYFTPVANITISKLAIVSSTTAAVGCTLARLGLFTVAADDSVTLVARSANDATIGAAAFTVYEKALATAGGFPASYSLVARTRYAAGFLQVAGTAMDIQGSFVVDGAVAPVPCRIKGSEADIQASYAVGSLSATFTSPYIRGRV